MEDLNYFKQFDIKFGTLGIGLHEYEIKVDKTFFSKHQNEEIKDAGVNILLKVNKKETMSVFDFLLEGTLTLACDICLEDLIYPFNTEEEWIIKISHEHKENEDDNIIYVNPNEYTYNIEQILYEIIYAQIPMRKVHKDTHQPCNQEMINWIEQNTQQQSRETDPRWDALKEIKLKK